MPGYQPWSPDRATERILAQVNDVLDEYREHLPLTIRQIFYRLVGAPTATRSRKRTTKTSAATSSERVAPGLYR